MTKLCRVAVAAAGAVVLGLLGAAATPAAPRAATFSDAAGDGGSGADITTVAVSDDASGVIRLAISVPNRPTPPADATFGIWFDSDRSPSTGEPGTGAENLLIVFVGRQTYSFARWNGSAFAGLQPPPIALGYTDGSLVLVLHKDIIQTVTGFNFWLVVLSGDLSSPTAVDSAPDSGSWGYQLVGVQPPTPAEPVVRSVTIVKTPAVPRAGRLFLVSASVRLSNGTQVRPHRVECTARLGGRTQPTTTRRAVRVCHQCSDVGQRQVARGATQRDLRRSDSQAHATSQGAVTSARVVLFGAVVAALLTQGLAASSASTLDGRPASGEEMRRLRAALTIAVDASVKGPLLGRSCWGQAPRRCRGFELPEIFAFQGKEYAESWFLLDRKPKAVDFERTLERGAWRARAGAGFRPPLPCRVLQTFERPCR